MSRFIPLLVACVSLAAHDAYAGEAPKSFAVGTKLKYALLFPSLSEVKAELDASGLRLDPLPSREVKLNNVQWNALTPIQQQKLFGSLMGYLGYAVGSKDQELSKVCIRQMLGGLSALGIDEKYRSYSAVKEILARIEQGSLPQERLVAALDDLRRQILRDADGKLDDEAETNMLACAWLRGASLLARQVDSDAEATKLSEFLVRPELIGFLEQFAAKVGSPQVTASRSLKSLLDKKKLTPTELQEFSKLADRVLE